MSTILFLAVNSNLKWRVRFADFLARESSKLFSGGLDLLELYLRLFDYNTYHYINIHSKCQQCDKNLLG